MLHAIDELSRYAAYFAALMVAGIAVLILTEIFSRNVLNVSLSFAFEYSAYFMATAIFSAAAFTMRTGGHVRVTILGNAAPAWAARGIELVATLVGTAAAVFLAYALVAFAWKSGVTGRTSATIDATPLVIPQGIMAFGACLLALQLLARLVRFFTGEPLEDLEARKTYSVE